MNSTPVRGELLKLLLGILTIVAAITLFSDLLVWHRMLILYPRWAAFTFLTTEILRVLAVVTIWCWSRTGVIVYLLLAVSSCVVCTVVGIPMRGILGVIGAMLLVTLVWPSWKHMPWGLLIRPSAGSSPSEWK